MKADDISLLDFLGQPKRTFSIPVYQRNYDWKFAHCKRLFFDIEKLCNEEENSHFLGTIVYVDGKTSAVHRDFVIIDGQQRLTSTMLLLKSLHYLSNEEDTKDDIIQSYLKNRNSKETYKLKLKPVEADSKVFVSIIEGIKMESKSTLFRNYNYFIEFVKNSKFTVDQILEAMHKLEIVAIQIDNQKENPQLIFESLNSTGLDLTQGDLVRNFLLMGHDYKKQNEYYKNYWRRIEDKIPNSKISDFLRDYLTLKTYTISKKEMVYESFKDYYKNVKNYNSEGFLTDLLCYSEFYSWFLYGNSNNDVINQKLSEIQSLKSTVTYPFLLNLFEDCYEFKKITEEELIEILDLIISYIFRRMICEIPTNALNKVFSKLYRDITRNGKENSYYKNISKILFNKKSSALFPRDEHFKNSLATRDFYSFAHKKYALSKIEKHKSKEVVNIENLTIEHIMPQKLTAKWKTDLGKEANLTFEKYLHTLGNLTLTGYNSELARKSFSEKVKMLSDSNLRINRDLELYSSWGKKEILERAASLGEVSSSILKFPNLSKEDNIDINDLNNEFSIMEDVNVTGRKPMQITFIGEDIKVRSWKEFFVNICQKSFEFDPEAFEKLIGHNDFKKINRQIISNDKKLMREPKEISDDIFIETKLSANDALSYSQMVIEKFEDLESEVIYIIS